MHFPCALSGERERLTRERHWERRYWSLRTKPGDAGDPALGRKVNLSNTLVVSTRGKWMRIKRSGSPIQSPPPRAATPGDSLISQMNFILLRSAPPPGESIVVRPPFARRTQQHATGPCFSRARSCVQLMLVERQRERERERDWTMNLLQQLDTPVTPADDRRCSLQLNYWYTKIKSYRIFIAPVFATFWRRFV